MGGIVASKPTICLSEEPLGVVDATTFKLQLFDRFDGVLQYYTNKISEIENFEKVVENYSHYYLDIYKIDCFKKKIKKSEHLPSHLDIGHKIATGFEECGTNYLESREDLESILTKARLLKITLKEYMNSAKQEKINLDNELENAQRDLDNAKYKETKLQVSIMDAQTENDQPKVDKIQNLLRQAATDTRDLERALEDATNQRKRKLENVLSHLEIMEKTRFHELKELASNFSKVQLDILETEATDTEIVGTKLDQITEDTEIKYFIAQCTKGDITLIKDDIPTPKIKISQIAYFNKILSDPEDADKIDLDQWLKDSSDKVKEEIESGRPFTDSEFPPNHNSIVGLQTVSKRIDLVWKRASEAYKSIKFGDLVSENVAPRKGGDSWLLSYLYCVAQKPELVAKLFSVREVNSAGIYEVNICVGGEFVKVVVDDHFPFDSKDQVPHFGSSTKEELWVPLVVKALAKAVGCFLKLEAHYYYLGFQALTGCPNYDITFTETNTKKTSFLDTCWNAIYQAPKKGYLINCFSRFDVEYGLDPSTSYLILDGVVKGDLKFLQLANPWKSTRWSGPWNDQDPQWTQEMKSTIKFNKNNERTFCMQYSDFVHCFSHVNICRYNPSLKRKTISIRVEQLENSQVEYPVIEFSFSIDPTECYIGIHQLHTIFKDAPFTNSVMGFVIIHKEQAKEVTKFITHTTEKEYSLHKNLKANTIYQLVPLLFQKLGDLKKIVLSVQQDDDKFAWKLNEKSQVTIGKQVMTTSQLKKMVY